MSEHNIITMSIKRVRKYKNNKKRIRKIIKFYHTVQQKSFITTKAIFSDLWTIGPVLRRSI